MTAQTAQIVRDRIGATVTHTDPAAMTFKMEREFDAPRRRVFAAFASCDAISKWWGPAGWTVPVCDMEFRPGGVWLYAMRAPAGVVGPKGEDPWDAWGKATYRDIVVPERIVWLDEFAEPGGTVAADMPKMTAQLEFIDLGGDRTKLVDTTIYSSIKDLETTLGMGMAEGAAESFDKLERYLADASD